MNGAVVFENLPLPPTSNSQYKTLFIRGKILHVSSTGLKQYKSQMNNYWLENAQAVKFAREALAGRPLEVHCEFRFHRERLFTKKGNFKKIDVSNRIKALHDSISRALLTDDCMFVKISAEKVCVVRKEDEGVTVTIALSDITEVS